MKKSSFIALILGTVSGVLFALGMCMALLPEWDAFQEGVIFGGVGIVLGLVTALVWCKMEGKTLPKLNGKNLFRIVYAVVSALVLGVGMCMIMVWNLMLPGILVGVVGIVLLLMLIPMFLGLK